MNWEPWTDCYENERECFNPIGISGELDMPRIRHLMKIGLFASFMVLLGDMLLGYGAADTAVASIPATFARYLSVSDGRIFGSAVLEPVQNVLTKEGIKSRIRENSQEMRGKCINIQVM